MKKFLSIIKAWFLKLFGSKRKKFIEKLRESARLCMEISDTEVAKHQYVSGLNWEDEYGLEYVDEPTDDTNTAMYPVNPDGSTEEDA